MSGDRSLERRASGAAYRSDLRLYIWGLALALILTAAPFAMVYWHIMTSPYLAVAIGGFALVQAIVRFRCFLHVNPPHENVDEMPLVFFTLVILAMMAGGTLWALGDLYTRMMS